MQYLDYCALFVESRNIAILPGDCSTDWIQPPSSYCYSEIIVRSLVHHDGGGRSLCLTGNDDVDASSPFAYGFAPLRSGDKQVIPIVRTQFDYYSSEEPVSVDSFTSSEEDNLSSTSTVILLKSSAEIDVDEICPNDLSPLPPPMQRLAIDYEQNGNLKNNLVKSNQIRYDADYLTETTTNGVSHKAKSSYDTVAQILGKHCLVLDSRETTESNCNGENESAKCSRTRKTPVTCSKHFSAFSKGKLFPTSMASYLI